MKLLATNWKKEIWFQELSRPFCLDAPFPGRVYVCILFANDESITEQEQGSLSEQLVRTGCRYAVCAGHESSSWDDSVDIAYLATSEDYSPPDNTFVMTSWHEGESVEEVILFGLNCTDFDDLEFQHYLVLSVGPRDGLEHEIRQRALSHLAWTVKM